MRNATRNTSKLAPALLALSLLALLVLACQYGARLVEQAQGMPLADVAQASKSEAPEACQEYGRVNLRYIAASQYNTAHGTFQADTAFTRRFARGWNRAAQRAAVACVGSTGNVDVSPVALGGGFQVHTHLPSGRVLVLGMLGNERDALQYASSLAQGWRK